MDKKTIDDRLFDVRLRARRLNKELITKEQEEAFLAGLEDCSDNLEISEVHLESKGGLGPDR